MLNETMRLVAARRLLYCCTGLIVIVGLPFQVMNSAVIPSDAVCADEPNTNPENRDEPGIQDESEAIDPTNKDALAWYMAGHKALKRGDLQDAADAFRSSSEAAPDSAVPLRALAIVLFRLGQPQDGLRTAQQAMEKDPDDWKTRMELAVVFGQNRQFPQALQLIEQALNSSRLEKNTREFLQCHQVRGALLLQGRQIGAAASSYVVILKALTAPKSFGLSDQEHENLLQNRTTGFELVGNVLLEAGRLQPAVQAFENLCRIRGDEVGPAQLMLARALYQQDKLEESEQRLREYFAAGLRNRDAMVLLQDLYRNTRRNEELPAELRRLTEGLDRPTVVQMYLGEVLLDRGETGQAAEVFRTVLDTSGDSEAYVGLIRVAIAGRDVPGLLDAVNQAARGRITAAELSPLTSGMVTLDGFCTSAIELCLQRFNEGPGDLHPLTTWFCAAIAEETEKTTQQAELLKATLELEPDQMLMLDTLDKFGTAQLIEGDGEMSVRVFEQLLAQPGLADPARVTTLFRISIAYEMIDNLEAAGRAAEEALKFNRNNPQLLARLAAVEILQGAYEKAKARLIEAIAVLEAAPPSGPGRKEVVERLADVRSRLAGLYGRMGDWSRAVEQYQTVIQMEGLNPEQLRVPKMLLSNAMVQDGDPDGGVAILEELYDSDPTDKGLNNDLGYLYADLGRNLEKAENMIRLAVEAEPDNPAYLDSLGWVLFRLGRNEDALEVMKKANAVPDYEDATLLEHQGDIHEALGQQQEAARLWQRALEVEQDSAGPNAEIVERLEKKLKD